MLERVRRLPGVEAAGYTTFLPLTFTGLRGGVAVEQRASRLADVGGSTTFRVVSDDYFRTLRIPVISGREFQRSDGPGTPGVAMVSRAFARRHWGEDTAAAVGRRIKPLSAADSSAPWITIVGVAGDVRQSTVDVTPVSDVYTPYRQGAPFVFAEPRDLAVRTRGDALALATAVRGAIRAVDPDQPIAQVRSMEEIVRGSAAGRRVYMYLLGSFAVLALGLAALGVYSVMAYLVSARTSEMAVRLALGAHPRQVRRLVLVDGAKLAAAGLVAGACGAFAVVRVLERILYQSRAVRRADVLLGLCNPRTRSARRLAGAGLARHADRPDAGDARRIATARRKAVPYARPDRALTPAPLDVHRTTPRQSIPSRPDEQGRDDEEVGEGNRQDGHAAGHVHPRQHRHQRSIVGTSPHDQEVQPAEHGHERREDQAEARHELSQRPAGAARQRKPIAQIQGHSCRSVSFAGGGGPERCPIRCTTAVDERRPASRLEPQTLTFRHGPS